MNNLKIKIRKILKELSIQQKEMIGKGLEHKIYSSLKYPDRLFKIGEKDVVDEWIQVFQADPNLFPIVYQVGQFSKNKNIFYVILEKLDVQKAIDEWDYLHEKMEVLNIIDEDDEGLYGRDLLDIYINHGDDKNAIEDILKQLENFDKKSFDIFAKWFKLIKDCEKVKERFVGHGTLIDAHKYNFGYSKDGKLKCLDI